MGEGDSSNVCMEFHPKFAACGDIVLRSKDGSNFRTHALFLKHASGFFRGMFEVAQNDQEPIQMDEDAETIEGFLTLISPGAGMPPNMQFVVLERLLVAADKFDMPGIFGTIRFIVQSKPILPEDALRLYTVARRFGWDDEAKRASTHTIGLNLLDPKVVSQTQGLDAEDYAKLLRLGVARKTALRAALDMEKPTRYTCGHCKPTIAQSWQLLKLLVLDEFDCHPSGNTLTEKAFFSQQHVVDYSTIRCNYCADHEPLFSEQDGLQKIVSKAISVLPKTIQL